jgi:predicted transcriptional regulator
MKKIPQPVLLSIKPEYVERIFSGEKTVELRRVVPKSLSINSELIIYSTSPEKCIVGKARLKKITRLPVTRLWDEIKNCAGIERKAFFSYFEGKSHGYALFLTKVKQFSHAFPLSGLRESLNFTPPQSFMYPSSDLLKVLQRHDGSIPYTY